MTKEEYKFNISRIINLYVELRLNDDQANKIFHFEKDKDSLSIKHGFTEWEEYDYTYTTFKELLTEEQFEKYEIIHNNNILWHQQKLIEQDKEITNQINYITELIKYYESKLLFNSVIIEICTLLNFLPSDKNKVDYLKSEYKQFLIDLKKESFINHFRECKIFMPNKLKKCKLEYNLKCLLPDYLGFEHQMDKPTLSIANCIKSNVAKLPNKTMEQITILFSELEEYSEVSFKKYCGEPKGWNFKFKTNTQEENVFQTLSLLLIDNERYGC